MVLGSRTATILLPLVTSEILAGLHAPLSNFGRVARQSTSVLICLGLAHAPSFLAICSIPSFGIAKVAANVCSPEIPTKMPTNRTAAMNFYACFQRVTKIFLKIWNQTSSLSYCYYLCFRYGA